MISLIISILFFLMHSCSYTMEPPKNSTTGFRHPRWIPGPDSLTDEDPKDKEAPELDDQTDKSSQGQLLALLQQKKKLSGYVRNGNWWLLKKALEKGGAIETENIFGQTLLQQGCMFGKVKVVKELLAHGANLHIFTHSQKDSIVHLAAHGPFPEIITAIFIEGQFFFQKKADDEPTEENIELITQYRIDEGKQLLLHRNTNNQTPLEQVKQEVQRLTQVKNQDKETKNCIEQLGKLIPLLSIELFEQNYSDAIEERVRILLNSKKKKK